MQIVSLITSSVVAVTTGLIPLQSVQQQVVSNPYVIAQSSEDRLDPGATASISVHQPGNWKICISSDSGDSATVTMVFNGQSSTFDVDSQRCFTPATAGEGYVKNVSNGIVDIEQSSIHETCTSPSDGGPPACVN